MPQGHPLLGEVQAALRDSELPAPEPIGMVYGSDLRLYNGAGVPTLHYGPGDPAYAHGPDERVAIDEGFDGAAEASAVADSPLADSGIDGSDEGMSGPISGVIGILGTFGVGIGVFGVLRVLRERSGSGSAATT